MSKTPADFLHQAAKMQVEILRQSETFQKGIQAQQETALRTATTNDQHIALLTDLFLADPDLPRIVASTINKLQDASRVKEDVIGIVITRLAQLGFSLVTARARDLTTNEEPST